MPAGNNMKIAIGLAVATAAVLYVQSVAAQTPPAPRSDTVPNAPPAPKEAPNPNEPSPPTRPLLPQTDNGVVKPPGGIDPEIVIPAPPVKSDMPVIKPDSEDGTAK